MSAKLNRDKPYGEVYGIFNIARYEQDGMLFDINGNQVECVAEVGDAASGHDVPDEAEIDKPRRGRKPKVE